MTAGKSLKRIAYHGKIGILKNPKQNKGNGLKEILQKTDKKKALNIHRIIQSLNLIDYYSARNRVDFSLYHT